MTNQRNLYRLHRNEAPCTQTHRHTQTDTHTLHAFTQAQSQEVTFLFSVTVSVSQSVLENREKASVAADGGATSTGKRKCPIEKARGRKKSPLHSV